MFSEIDAVVYLNVQSRNDSFDVELCDPIGELAQKSVICIRNLEKKFIFMFYVHHWRKGHQVSHSSDVYYDADDHVHHYILIRMILNFYNI